MSGLARTGAVAGILAAVLAALIAVELGRGALDERVLAVADACAPASTVERGGVDGAVQRVVLRALAGAACRLQVSQADLFLRLAEAAAEGADLPPEVEGAVRDGLVEAVDAERDAERIDRVTAFVLRGAAERAPVGLLLQAVERLA